MLLSAVIRPHRLTVRSTFKHYSTVNSTLRPYQRQCVESVLSALKNRKRPAVSLPTGSGKTRVFSYLLSHVACMYPEDSPRRSKVLVVVNRKELMDQAVRSINGMQEGLNVGYIFGKTTARPENNVIVATYQTLCNSDRLLELDPEEYKLIIIDEAHHSVASSYIKILEHFKAIGEPKITYEPYKNVLIPDDEPVLTDTPEDGTSPPEAMAAYYEKTSRLDHPDRRVHVIGFSATFWRGDTKALNHIYDEVCYHESVETMIEEGFLCPAVLTSVEMPSEMRRQLGERFRLHNTETLSASDFFTSPEGVQLIFQTWKENIDRKYTVIFGSSMQHLQDISTIFRNNGVDARIIDGKMKKGEREAIIRAFGDGEFPVLLNCQILTEGTDIPPIDQVIIARGLKSKGMAMQMIGRGLRLCEGKNDCNVVIFSDFHRFVGAFLPELSPVAKIKKADDPENDTEEGKVKAGAPLSDRVNYRELLINEKEEFSFSMLTSEDYKPISPGESIFGWICAKRKYYFFPASTDSNYYMTIYKEGGKTGMWIYSMTYKLAKNFKRCKVLLKSSKLHDVIRYADNYILNNVRSPRLSLINAKWRTKEATPKQQDVVRDELKSLGLDISHINRGLAHSLISLKILGVKLTPELVRQLAEPYSNTT